MKKELVVPPRGGVGDYHAHVFPGGVCNVKDPWYVPDYDATVEEYLEHLRTHGVDWGMLVQPSFLGDDNSFMLRIMKNHPDRFLGVVVVDHVHPMSAAEKLYEWDRLGVRGVRLNLYGLDIPDLRSEEWVQFIDKIAELDWFLQFYCKTEQLSSLVDPIRELPCKVVIDHLGFPESEDIDDHPLLQLIDLENLWVKASGAYRSPRGLSKKMYFRLVEEGFERLVPGSDWPHTLYRENPTEAWDFFDLEKKRENEDLKLGEDSAR